MSSALGPFGPGLGRRLGEKVLGKTTGRGKQSNSYVPNRSIKDVLGYPLTKQFRELLMGRG
jgi:hypothetical protein